MSDRNWYAVQRDADDNDWGTGSFDWEEAVTLAKERGYTQIVEIDGGYDANGRETYDPVAAACYYAGEDF